MRDYTYLEAGIEEHLTILRGLEDDLISKFIVLSDRFRQRAVLVQFLVQFSTLRGFRLYPIRSYKHRWHLLLVPRPDGGRQRDQTRQTTRISHGLPYPAHG